MEPKKTAAQSTKTEAAYEIRQLNFKLKTFKPLQGITTFESLRLEWARSHPDHSEIELLEACKQFAKLAGLHVREQIYQQTINSLKGEL